MGRRKKHPTPHVSEHIGVRINDLDMMRGVEQTAILMALGSAYGLDQKKKASADSGGTAGKYRPTAAQLALTSLLGYLAHTHCKGNVIHVDDRDDDTKPKHKLWSLFHGSDGFFGLAPDEARWRLEIVLSAVDGLRGLLAGNSGGAVSAIAGGPPGSFIRQDHPDLVDSYLVVAARLKTPERLWAPDVCGRDADAETCLQKLLERLKALMQGQSILSIATATNESDYASKRIRPLLQAISKSRTFTGSSVAAGLSAFFPRLGIDAYVGVMRKTHVILLSVAAKATGGQIVAIPIGKEKQSKVAIAHDKVVMDEQRFAPGDGDNDSFLVVTGLTENLILKGVRFLNNQVVTTHSLILRSRTQSSRFITHYANLRTKPFRFLRNDNDLLGQTLAEFKRRGTPLRAHYLLHPRRAGSS